METITKKISMRIVGEREDVEDLESEIEQVAGSCEQSSLREAHPLHVYFDERTETINPPEGD